MFNDRERKLLRKALALYAGEHVVAKVLAQGESFLTPHAESTELTLLFLDVASFTVVDGVTPDSLLEWQRAYAEVITETVARSEGTFDTFVGDSGSAWWGEGGQVHHAQKAVACAEALLSGIAELNRRSARSRFPGVQLRIGVHTGHVALGNHGSSRRLRYCGMGDAVNLAARLCSLPREHPIILSRTTYELLSAKSQIEALGAVPVQDGGTLEIYGLGKAVEHAV